MCPSKLLQKGVGARASGEEGKKRREKRRFCSTRRSAAACVVHHGLTYRQPMQWRIAAPANDVSAPRKKMCVSLSEELAHKTCASTTGHFLSNCNNRLVHGCRAFSPGLQRWFPLTPFRICMKDEQKFSLPASVQMV